MLLYCQIELSRLAHQQQIKEINWVYVNELACTFCQCKPLFHHCSSHAAWFSAEFFVIHSIKTQQKHAIKQWCFQGLMFKAKAKALKAKAKAKDLQKKQGQGQGLGTKAKAKKYSRPTRRTFRSRFDSDTRQWRIFNVRHLTNITVAYHIMNIFHSNVFKLLAAQRQ